MSPRLRAILAGAHGFPAGCVLLAGGVATLLSAPVAFGADDSSARQRPVDGIMDNSFLVEEAYNQEPGVVQSILTVSYGVEPQPGPDDISWTLVFTQEWPVFSQRHQFSYTVPYNFVKTGGKSDNGLGDMLLNYRYQAYYDEIQLRAFAPRASLVLPTGNKDLGFSDDTFGLQLNLPFSSAWGDRWFTHFNAGLTWLPHAFTANDRNTLDYNLGASVIYAATRDTHFLLEWTGLWDNTPGTGGGLTYEFVSVISPGVRHAFNFGDGSQLVIGAAVPLGLTRGAPDVGVLLYVSFEAQFWKPN